MVEFCELCVIFLSTPSARRATFNKVHKTNLKYISIHALCEEGDSMAAASSAVDCYFYPRPLRGGRPYACPPVLSIGRFLSTPSARRATCVLANICAGCSNFYPRPLRGGRHRSRGYADTPVKFLSTPSARRATF